MTAPAQVESYRGLPLVVPAVPPPLDPQFRPAILANIAFRRAAREAGAEIPVELALEQADGSVSRFRTVIWDPARAEAAGNLAYLERLVKFLLWSRGGCRLHFAGPPALGQALLSHYRDTATGKFDAQMMGERIYERAFEVVLSSKDAMPPERQNTAALGRHLEGCRIGFDLGASDRKVAAVKDGEVVYSEEVLWDPRSHSDPQWHFDQIMDSLRHAAEHLPRVDAIGGSAAGVYVNNRVKVASLFRGVPEPLFQQRVKSLFLELQRAWNGIPFDVVNDGEVTALAGAMAIEHNAVLGIALGSSQAGGFVDREGKLTSWLNELAFVPVDYHPHAAKDEWSGDFGCGAQYFSQQCVARLLPASGLEIDPTLPPPEKLVRVQEVMARNDARAARIYTSIGVYLGYTLPHYAEFYDFDHLLLLGRVTTGRGGELIVEAARQVLALEFPDLAQKIGFHMPDEKSKRHGQAIAAASLPALGASHQ